MDKFVSIIQNLRFYIKNKHIYLFINNLRHLLKVLFKWRTSLIYLSSLLFYNKHEINKKFLFILIIWKGENKNAEKSDESFTYYEYIYN